MAFNFSYLRLRDGGLQDPCVWGFIYESQIIVRLIYRFAMY